MWQSNVQSMKRSWCQNVLLKQKVMPISQTSLKITHASPDVPKRYFRLHARDHIVGTSKLFWYIYRLDIYIVSIYVHTHVTWMLACASCTSCSSAGALAIMLSLTAVEETRVPCKYHCPTQSHWQLPHWICEQLPHWICFSRTSEMSYLSIVGNICI